VLRQTIYFWNPLVNTNNFCSASLENSCKNKSLFVAGKVYFFWFSLCLW
jgi:hypothetical protein